MTTADERIDLNAAPVDELTEIPGVGATMARRIAEARAERLFDDWDDLCRVRGIGASKLEDIKTAARIGPADQQADVGEFDALLVREFLGEPELVAWFGIEASLEETDGDFDREDARHFLDRLADELSEADWESALAERIEETDNGQVRYRAACWKALCHGLLGDYEAAFDALRTAADVDDEWARHHHIYGLLHGARQRTDDARFELGLALAEEPYPDTRQRIENAARRC